MTLFDLLPAILRPLTPAVEIVATLRMLLGHAAIRFGGPRARMALAGPAGVQFVRDRRSSPAAATAAAVDSILDDAVRDDSASSAMTILRSTIPDDDSVWTTNPHRRRRRFFAKISRRFSMRARIRAPPRRGHQPRKQTPPNPPIN